MARKPSTIPSVESSAEEYSPVLSKNEKRLESRLSALDKHNVTDERLARALDEGLNAGRVVEEVVQGEIVERVEPDYNVRQKYLDMGMKAREWGVVEKVSVNIDNRRTISLSAEDRRELEGIADRLGDLNSMLDMGEVQDGEIVANEIIGEKMKNG